MANMVKLPFFSYIIHKITSFSESKCLTSFYDIKDTGSIAQLCWCRSNNWRLCSYFMLRPDKHSCQGAANLDRY